MPYETVPRDHLLVETDWLAAHLRDPGLRVIDIRGVIRPPDAPKPWYLCNAGVSASVGLFGLRLAGHPRAANFAGSWYEWETQPDTPAASGEP